MITVYQCIIDGYDHLRSPKTVNPNVRYVCFSDAPMPKIEPWEIQPAYQPLACKSRNSRIPKILPHLHLETDYSIWYDGSLCMAIDPEEAVSKWLNDSDIAMFRHPCRTTIRQEREICIRERIGDPDEITAQVERYHAEGFPEDFGLWAGGVIMRRHTPAVEQFNETWWKAYQEGSARDQFAAAYAFWKSGLRPATIPGDVLKNNLWPFMWHADFTTRGDNPDYEVARQKRLRRAAKLRDLCA